MHKRAGIQPAFLYISPRGIKYNPVNKNCNILQQKPE